MPYDEELAARVRALMGPEADERRMFGGLAFLLGGHMAVAASGQGGLMVRVDPAQTARLLAEPHARPFEMRGRELDGWLRVDPEGLEDDHALSDWVGRGVAYVASLPPKTGGRSSKRGSPSSGSGSRDAA